MEHRGHCRPNTKIKFSLRQRWELSNEIQLLQYCLHISLGSLNNIFPHRMSARPYRYNYCALRGMRGPEFSGALQKNPRLAPPRRTGQGTKSTERGGARHLFGPRGHIPVLGPHLLTGPRLVHPILLEVSTMLFTVATLSFMVATLSFTVAMVFFAPYVNFWHILSS